MVALSVSDWPLFKQLADFLGFLLRIFYDIGAFVNIKSIAFYIFLFAVLSKLVMLPFDIASQRNSKISRLTNSETLQNNRTYNPTEIEYFKPKIKLERFIVSQKYGMNKNAGCLMFLFQLPIFITFYSIVQNLEKVIPKLAAMDPAELEGCYQLFGQNIKDKPGLTALAIIPIATALIQFISSCITTKLAGGKFSLSLLISPIMSLYFGFSFSTVFGIYWFAQTAYSTIFTIIISLVYRKKTEKYFIDKCLTKLNKDRQKRGLSPLSEPIEVPITSKKESCS